MKLTLSRTLCLLNPNLVDFFFSILEYTSTPTKYCFVLFFFSFFFALFNFFYGSHWKLPSPEFAE